MHTDIFAPYETLYKRESKQYGYINEANSIAKMLEELPQGEGFAKLPFYCYAYDSIFAQAFHLNVPSYSSGEAILRGTVIDYGEWVKHYVSFYPNLLVQNCLGDTDRISNDNYNNNIGAFKPLDIDFKKVRLGMRYNVMHKGNKQSTNVDSTKDLIENYNTGDYVVKETKCNIMFLSADRFTYNGNGVSDISINYNVGDQWVFGNHPTEYGQQGLQLVPQWWIRLRDYGAEAYSPFHDADTGFLFQGLGVPEVKMSTQDDFYDLETGCLLYKANQFYDGVEYKPVLTVEQCLKEVAFLGMVVCDYTDPNNTDNLYIGYINQDGLATGELIPYKDWEKSDSLNIVNDKMSDYNEDIDVKPKPIPPVPEDDEKSEYSGAPWLGNNSVSIDSGMYYREMSPANLFIFKNIIKDLKSYERAHATYIQNARNLGILDTIAAEKWTEAFPTPADYTAYIYDRYGYGEDPINSITSLIAFPFDLESGDSESINSIGAEDLYISIPIGIAGSDNIEYRDVIFSNAAGVGPFTLYKYPKITKSSYKFVLVDSVTLSHPKGYTDFRAYSPYTRLELYIPMHGTIDLDPAVVMDKTLSVQISVTLADGSSVATVLINDSIYQTINGQVGYSIPLSAEASSTNNLALKTLSAQSQSQRLNAIGNVIHGLASTATSIATGNYSSAAGSVLDSVLTGQQNAINTSAIKYQIEHATDGKIVVGQPSSLNAFLVHPKCQLIWHLPLMQYYNPEIYGKTVGYKCHKTTTLGALTGYTECSNASLDNVSCTEAEKTIILEQLKNGIII